MHVLLVGALLKLLGQPAPMDVGDVARFPHRFIGKSVVVCGVPTRQPTGRIVLWSRQEEFLGIYIDPATEIATDRYHQCIAGRFRRVDGLTFEEALAGPGLYSSIATHTPAIDYILATRRRADRRRPRTR